MKADVLFSSCAGARGMWPLWLVAAAVVLALHLSTATLSPVAWQDEVQILDWGRGFMPGGDQASAMSWLYEGRTYRMICYLGCVMQETAYRLAGGEMFGPRASSILGAVLASAALLGWLMARGTVPWIALACSLLLLCDPAFTLGYRGARVDSWAIAFMLLACWAGVKGRQEARGARQEAEDGRRGTGGRGQGTGDAAMARGAWREESMGDFDKGNFDILKDSLAVTSDSLRAPGWRALGWFVLAGICTGIAGVIWVSAILLLPLLGHELGGRGARGKGQEVRGEGREARRARLEADVSFMGTVVVGVAALVSVGLLFVPVWSLLPEMWGDFSARGGGQVSRLLDGAALQKLLWSLLGNPLLVPLALVGLLLVRQWGLLLAFLLAVALTLYTGPYVHRAVYLLPYILVGVASAGTVLWTKDGAARWMRPAVGIVLWFMLTWSAALSVAGRNFVAWKEKTERDPALVLEWARSTVGPGPAKVYLWTWDWYYAGRKLGWSLYKSFAWENMQDQRFTDLLSRMDWLVVAEKDLHRPDDAELAILGFRKKEVVGGSSVKAVEKPGRGYGTYLVYRKGKESPAAAATD
jgi:hypothetical protein